MNIGVETSGISIVIPLGALGGRFERIAVAKGFERVNVRMEEIIAEVRFSSEYRAEESVAVGRTVAAWGFIFGRVRVRRPVPGAPVAPVAMLSVSEVVLMDAVGAGVMLEVCGAVADGCGIPVSAVQISAIGGSASKYGTVKRGLSQRLWVLGSS